MRQHEPPFELREIKIEVTHACPLVCVHCSSDAMPTCQRVMSNEDCRRVVTEANDLGVRAVAFSGGEPLVWPGIADATVTASALGMEVSIYTSGNVPNQQEVLASLARGGAARFVFSVFGASAETHDRVTRTPGSFARTLAAISHVSDLGISPEIHFVPLVENYEQLEAVAKLGARNGVSRVSVLRFVPQGRGQLIAKHGLDGLQNLKLKKTIERLRAGGAVVRTGSPYNFLLLNDQPECCSAIDRLIVGPELDIFPCDAFKQVRAEEVVGTSAYSRLDQFSLRDCWERSPFLHAVREYLTTPFAAPCDSCEMLTKCLSGCLAQKVVASGNFDKRPDPSCLRRKG